MWAESEVGGKEGCFGLFVAYPSDYCCYELTTICQTRKKTHRKPPPITKKKSLTFKMYSLWSTVFRRTVLVLSEGWCAFWAYQRSVMFLCLSSVFLFRQVSFQQTNSEFVKARLKFLKAAPVFSHPNLLKFKYKMDMQMHFWQLLKS